MRRSNICACYFIPSCEHLPGLLHFQEKAFLGDFFSDIALPACHSASKQGLLKNIFYSVKLPWELKTTAFAYADDAMGCTL